MDKEWYELPYRVRRQIAIRAGKKRHRENRTKRLELAKAHWAVGDRVGAWLALGRSIDDVEGMMKYTGWDRDKVLLAARDKTRRSS